MDISKLHILDQKHSVLSSYLNQLRDIKLQKNKAIFRNNLEQIGRFMAFELSKELSFKDHLVQTPLGNKKTKIINDDLVIATIFRAGLPLYNGVLSVFNEAESLFIGAARVENDNSTEVEIKFDYISGPSIDGKVLIITDPMLATGSSLILALEQMLKKGTPKSIHFVCVVAAPEGIQAVHSVFGNATFWIASLDDCLNDKSYIVPGLGDAGDLAFGIKQ